MLPDNIRYGASTFTSRLFGTTAVRWIMDHGKATGAAMALGVSTNTDYPPHGLAPGTGHFRSCSGWTGPGPGPGMYGCADILHAHMSP